MASKKKSEGIALLSIYGDDEDDDMEQEAEEPECQNLGTVPVEQTDRMDYTANEVADESVTEEENVLEKFLPPPPKDKCSDALQEKIIKFIALKKTTGRSFNAEVRNRKEYRNPDFLLHAVTYQDIDHIGSCLFDPHGYDKTDFYDEIEADMRREVNLLNPGVAPVAAVDTVTRDGRHNKKSKNGI